MNEFSTMKGNLKLLLNKQKIVKKVLTSVMSKCSVGGDIMKGENDDIGNSTIITKPVESGNETKYAHDIVIDPRESGMQINKNNDDNSDVVKSLNKNMNEVQYC